jgi:hypothetical protein
LSERLIRGALIVLCAFVALTALPSAVFVVPSLPSEWLMSGPFSDYVVPALALFAVGVVAAAAAFGVFSTPKLGALAALVAGLAMMLFELVEVAVVGIALVEYPDLPQSWLQPIYFAIGLAIVVLAAALYRGGETRVELSAA